MRSIPLIRCLSKMSSSTSTGSQIATWRRSLTWTRHDFTSDLWSPSTGMTFIWSPASLWTRLNAIFFRTVNHNCLIYQTSCNDFWSLYHRNGDFITQYSNVLPPVQLSLSLLVWSVAQHINCTAEGDFDQWGQKRLVTWHCWLIDWTELVKRTIWILGDKVTVSVISTLIVSDFIKHYVVKCSTIEIAMDSVTRLSHVITEDYWAESLYARG